MEFPEIPTKAQSTYQTKADDELWFSFDPS
jgi:hypothetical protein